MLLAVGGARVNDVSAGAGKQAMGANTHSGIAGMLRDDQASRVRLCKDALLLLPGKG